MDSFLEAIRDWLGWRNCPLETVHWVWYASFGAVVEEDDDN